MSDEARQWRWWPPENWKYAALYVWLALLAVTVFISIGPGWERAAVWLGDQDIPAWVQAIGSVAAILFAVGVSEKQARRTELMRASDHAQRYSEIYGPAIALIEETQRRLSTSFQNALGSGAEVFGVDVSFFNGRHSLHVAFETIPVHQMPTVASATAILKVRELYVESDNLMRYLGDKINRFTPFSQSDIEVFDSLIDEWNLQLAILRSDLVAATSPTH